VVQTIAPHVALTFPLGPARSASVSSLCLYVDRQSHGRAVAVGLYSGEGHRLIAAGSTASLRAGAWNLVPLPRVRLRGAHRYWIAILSGRGVLAIRRGGGRRCDDARAAHLAALPKRWRRLSRPGRAAERAAPCPLSAYTPAAAATPPASSKPPDLTLPQCTETIGSKGDLAAALRAAAPGTVLCLDSGVYEPAKIISGVTPASLVSIEPAPGATVVFTATLTLAGPIQDLALLGFQAPSNLQGGITIDSSAGPVTNLAISYDNFDGSEAPGEGQLVIADAPARSNIIISHDTFTNVSPCPDGCGEGTIYLYNTAADNDPDGVTIANNLIGGGLADGINIGGSESGTHILHNEITDKLQGSSSQCAAYGGVGGCPHTDGIQFEGDSRDVVISGNYMHANTDDLLQADGSNTDITVTNNVFAVADPTVRAVQVAGWHGGVFSHNTVSSYSTWDCTHEQTCTSGVTLTDNIFLGGFGYGVQTGGGQFSSESYNLTTYCPVACGDHDLRRLPAFRGGPAPRDYLGWQLAPGSVGVRDASDGSNRGANDFSVAPGP
jgi:hypothetical protein